MQTQLLPEVLATPEGQEANEILRACVHCGFCTATCPTYQLFGDELDGPRGRIYQIKEVLEGKQATRTTQKHLDRCLTCLNCTTTCPSGVKYNRLIDIGRQYVERQVSRPLFERFMRWGMMQILPYRKRFTPLLRIGQMLQPMLPDKLAQKIPPKIEKDAHECSEHLRKVVRLTGCVQRTIAPNTDTAAARVLDQLGIEVIFAEGGGCCGSVNLHLNDLEGAKKFMRHNIDAWWPHIESGAEAVLITESGCGVLVKDYAYHLRDDAEYAEKAEKISELSKDLCEIITPEMAVELAPTAPKRIAFHPPCTLQHGQKLAGKTEALLEAAGFELLPVKDSHTCCGSAGTYSILHPDISNQLKANKLAALEIHDPVLIATANVGCQSHLQTGTAQEVVHWIELFDPHHRWPNTKK